MYPGTGPSALETKGVKEPSEPGWLAGSAAELWDVSLLQHHCAPNDSVALLSASESKQAWCHLCGASSTTTTGCPCHLQPRKTLGCRGVMAAWDRRIPISLGPCAWKPLGPAELWCASACAAFSLCLWGGLLAQCLP